MLKAIISYVNEWISTLWQIIRLRFKSDMEKDLEIIALRSQLALYINKTKDKKITKPQSTLAFRQLWVILSLFYSKWKSLLAVLKPATVVGWHRNGWKIYWTRKSKKGGRPPLSKEVVEIIQKIHEKNQFLSPEKIHELLVLKGLKNPPAPNTIAKYLPKSKGPNGDRNSQSWLTFLKNHAYETWGTDFFTIPTLTFDVLYVLIIIDHKSRKIVHFAVTKNPNMFWLKQQFRNATPYGKKPKYLIHDNDPVFKSKVFQKFLADSGIQSKPTSFRSPWQNPYAERVVGTIRRELLDYIIPLSERHLEKLLDEYINEYYNTERTHQGINCKTPIAQPINLPVDIENFKLKATPVLNGLYHTYERIA